MLKKKQGHLKSLLKLTTTERYSINSILSALNSASSIRSSADLVNKYFTYRPVPYNLKILKLKAKFIYNNAVKHKRVHSL